MTALHEASAHFPADPSSAGAARRFLAGTLETWSLDSLEEVACLLVSELVSNVLLHAETELDVHLRRTGDRVRVEVHDGSPRLPERKFYSVSSATGRGLVFVAELSSSWGIEPMPGGKAVWFELDDAHTVAPPPLVAADFNLDDWEDWEDLTDDPAPADEGPDEDSTTDRAPASLHLCPALVGVS